MGTDDNQNPTEGNPPAWMAQLSDDLKGNEGLTKFENITDLGKSYLDLAGQSEGSIKVPGENATDEEKSSFYTALGRPESPDGYEFTRPQLPEGIVYDEAQEKMFREFAHQNGFSGQQAKAVYDLFHQQVIDSHQTYVKGAEEAQKEAEAVLKKEWGEKYPGNIELAKRAYRAFGDEETTQFLNMSRLGDNPIFIRMFHKVALALSEDNLVDGKFAGKERERTLSGKPMLDFPSMKDT